MATGTVWRVLLLLCVVAKTGHATPHDRLTTWSGKPARHLQGVSCTASACDQANAADVTKFISYMSGTADDTCNCTCTANGDTLMHQAATSERTLSNIMIQRLVSKKCSTEVVDDEGSTPLHDACRICNIRQAMYLMQHSANIMAVNNATETPLCLCLANCEDHAYGLLLVMLKKWKAVADTSCLMCGNSSAADISKGPQTNMAIEDLMDC